VGNVGVSEIGIKKGTLAQEQRRKRGLSQEGNIYSAWGRLLPRVWGIDLNGDRGVGR